MMKHNLAALLFLTLALSAHSSVSFAGDTCPPGIACDAAASQKCLDYGNCKTAGACLWKKDPNYPGCIAAYEEDCQKSDACRDGGACHLKNQLCTPLSDDDCKKSAGCSKSGACELFPVEKGLSRCVRNKRFAKAESSEAACTAMGGTWEAIPRSMARGCIMPTTDAGKTCQDSKECEGACVHYQCSSTNQVRGCGIISDGKILCVD